MSRAPLQCVLCGKAFTTRVSKPKQRFCSRKCARRVQPPQRLPRTSAEILSQRSRVDAVTGCIEWTGPKKKAPSNYGQLVVDRKHYYAHRVSYELAYGPIPPDMCVCHKCDNPPCINPAHLFLGTHGDNAADKIWKGRQAKGTDIPQTHLTEDDVRTIFTDQRAIAKIAQHYGLSRSAVFGIQHRHTWRHVTNTLTGAPIRRTPRSETRDVGTTAWIQRMTISDTNSGCWLWLGRVDEIGHGTLKVANRARGAHRVSYEAFVGPIPDGFILHHRCGTPACVNPQHLEPMTSPDNLRRHFRLQTHCKRNHPLSGDNLYLHNGRRQCRACKLAAKSERYWALKAAKHVGLGVTS
jgi:hypothetical protein